MICKFASIFVLIFLSSIASAQISEIEARKSAESSFRSNSIPSYKEPLHVWRQEQMEEQLRKLRTLSGRRHGSGAFVYSITRTGNFINSEGEVVAVTSTGYDVPVLVVVSVDSGQAFVFHQPMVGVDTFNAMVRDIKLEIRTESDAAELARLFYIMANDTDESRFVSSATQFRHQVEDYLISRYGEQKASRIFYNWSRTFERTMTQIMYGIQIAKVENGFLAKITYTSAISAHLILKQISIHLSTSGQVVVELDRKLYPFDNPRRSS